MGHGLGRADHFSPSLWPGPLFSHRQLLIDFPHGGRSAVWGRSLAFRNKPHCSSRSQAFLPLIFLLQPLAFLLVLLLFLQCKSISCLSVTKGRYAPRAPTQSEEAGLLNSRRLTHLMSQVFYCSNTCDQIRGKQLLLCHINTMRQRCVDPGS